MRDWRRTLDFVLFRFVTVASPLLLLLLLRHLLHLFIRLSCFIQVNFIRFLLRPFQDRIFSHRRVVFWGGLRYVMGTGNGTISINGHWQLLEAEIWGNQRDFIVRTNGDTSNPALVTWTLGGKVVTIDLWECIVQIRYHPNWTEWSDRLNGFPTQSPPGVVLGSDLNTVLE